MAPKGKRQPTPTPTDSPDLSTMDAQFAEIKASLGQLISKMDSIERSLHELRVENTAVREELAAAKLEIVKRDETIFKLSEQVNKIDQSSRANSIRIFGLPVTHDTPQSQIHKIVFDEIVAPIVMAARTAGDLPPNLNPTPLTIDHAFVIPTKKGNSCPVVVKLSSFNTRNLIFKYKKNTLPQDRDLGTNRIRNRYSIFEDLTTANHAQLRSFSADPRVKSIWSFNGQIRFKTQDSEFVYKVKSLSDTVESLIKPSSSPPSGPTAMSP